ncbi:MAG: zinc transporter ZntB [Alphaproteobacteria bacterium]|nr:zinc transporter ZntB [Alphaproteobacteria bacterium]
MRRRFAPNSADAAGARASERDGLVYACVLDGKGGARALPDWRAVDAWKAADGPLWIHLNREAPRAQRWIMEGAGLDSQASIALCSKGTRARATAIGEGDLVILRGLNLNEGADPEDMVAVRCWLEPSRLITTRTRSFHGTREMREALGQGKGPTSVADAFVFIADRCQARAADMVEGLDATADELEVRVMAEPESGMRHDLAVLRRQAIELRRYLAPQRDALMAIVKDGPEYFAPDHMRRLRRLGEDTERFVEDLDMIRERAVVVQDEIFSALSVAQGRSTLALSIVATIVLPLTLLTGILGVNVGGMFEGRFGPEWWLLLATLAGIAFLTTLFLKIFKVI